MVHGSNIYYSKVYQKRKFKEYTISSGTEKNKTSQAHVPYLSISRGGLGILFIDTQLNSLKAKWVQRLLNLTNALWKGLMVYRLNIILNSNQDLALFRQR